MGKYYEAYDERYRAVHARGVSWSSAESTPIVLDTIEKYGLGRSCKMLEIGCGEGRDSRAVLEKGCRLLATDISEEAIAYCKETMPQYREHFAVLDCLKNGHEDCYDFIYAVAVLHMLVLDEDRALFYRFLREHLTQDGVALICTMGDGAEEMQSDITRAFDPVEREHESGRITVTGTSCRKVSFATLEQEICANGLELLEKGITEALPNFDSLMFAIVRRKEDK